MKILLIYPQELLSGSIVSRKIKCILEDHDVDLYGVSSPLDSLKKALFGEKYDVVIATCSSRNITVAPYFLFSKADQKIFFPYDISHFCKIPGDPIYRLKCNIGLLLEKLMFLKSDKIIHKGLSNELEYLPFYDSKIKNKSEYLFREFLNNNLIQEYNPDIKLSKKDGEIHLVYVGGLFLEDVIMYESFYTFYPKITNQKIHLHIYSKISRETLDRFKEIEKEDMYFHYEGALSHDELIKEITKYDYGIQLFGNDKNIPYNLSAKLAFSNKLYDYCCANLPIIANTELEAVYEFVNNNNEDLGVSLKYTELSKLSNKLKYIEDNGLYEVYVQNINTLFKKINVNSLIEFITE
ncbi:hypothetical protein M2325_000908 [Methanococcus voltae PS]|uniref:Glycosyltransferase n=2 Tax=Methanococcus voltae TaxID=2188 RepID=Q2EMU5_METVO|nr:hypothetical protein [Methanococcus voltae]ABD17739.1 glycosyltransferase [Methanococcus voltae PS]MCS3922223.1 hypothetical protein [Methanococcus voltae PS]